ncbi:MAG TPA: triple tyrosine motif-containing protein, partial [Chryseosolibacter sp.]|nr:triple tyrosine motif-containing protein [Chryseosolibacter sp.]
SKLQNFRAIPGEANSLPDDRVQVIHRDQQGILWVGTENGLAAFNGVDRWKRFARPEYPSALLGSNVQGQAFVEAPNGTIWIGTWFGLNRITPDRQNVSYFTADTTGRGLSSEHVISLCLDTARNLMWIGTFGGGLNRLDIASGAITQFTEDDGLANNTIYSIKPDNEGNLWLSTTNGLSKFDPLSGRFRNYDATEGLQGNEFYWGAGARTSDGKLLFGGVNGLTFFDPSEIRDNLKVPPVVITSFEIFNKPVGVGPGSVLAENINFMPELILNYDQNVLTFEYSALNYDAPEKNSYAYYLENFDRDWNFVGGKRNVSYTNLNPGHYVLRVRGSNNDGVWNEQGIALTIVVVPPFWKTWWFYTMATIFALGVVSGIIKLRLQSVRRDKERVRKTLQEALDKAHAELDRERQAVIDEQNKNFERNWIDQSMSIASEILSKNKSNVNALCNRILSALLKRCEVVAGAIYIYDEENDELGRHANVGFTNARASVPAGSGQIGECFRKKTLIAIDNLPAGYFPVTSGLGEAVPKSLLLVPLQFEDNCIGVIELASFGEIPTYRRLFIESMAAQLTATIHTTQVSERTARLLEESRIQTEELRVREEELRQNLEEMQAIQEDYSRKATDYEAMIAELRGRVLGKVS